jgi:hypothetical protein
MNPGFIRFAFGAVSSDIAAGNAEPASTHLFLWRIAPTAVGPRSYASSDSGGEETLLGDVRVAE